MSKHTSKERELKVSENNNVIIPLSVLALSSVLSPSPTHSQVEETQKALDFLT